MKDVLEWLSVALLGGSDHSAATEDAGTLEEAVVGAENAGTGKLLVFAHHRDVMDRLHEGLHRILTGVSRCAWTGCSMPMLKMRIGCG